MILLTDIFLVFLCGLSGSARDKALKDFFLTPSRYAPSRRRGRRGSLMLSRAIKALKVKDYVVIMVRWIVTHL